MRRDKGGVDRFDHIARNFIVQMNSSRHFYIQCFVCLGISPGL